MKKFLFLVAVALLFSLPLSVKAMCLGPGPESYLVASKTSAIANGSDTITITAHAGCNIEGVWSYSNNDDLRLVVSGANVAPAQQNNNRAAVNFTLTSTSAGSKSVQMQVYTDVEWGYPEKGQTWLSIGSPLALNFTAPATPEQTPVSTKATTPKQTQTATAITAANATSPSSSETPVAAATLSKVNNEDFSAGQSYDKGETITLSGKAAANSTVKLYIYSELKTAETTADAEGNWSYEVNGLEPGDHRIEAEVIDSTGKVSEKVQIASFSVVESAQAESNESTTNQAGSNYYIFAGSAIVLIAVALLIYRRQKSKKTIGKFQADGGLGLK